MKARTIALLWVMAAALAAAQTAPPSQRVAPESKKAAGQAAVAAKPAVAPTTAAPKHTPAPAKSAAAKAAKKTAAKAKKPSPVKEAALRSTAPKPRGQRDPFLSPIREGGTVGPSCHTGKKCLAINAIVLKGIVKSQGGMIAVVESTTGRIAYFLRENDPVFNGYVVKITGDTIVFRENVMDRLGKESTRDVVMKVVAPVV